jgi:hypothetical protein
MNSFTILPENSWFTNPKTNARQCSNFLSKPIKAFYHADYSGGGQWHVQGTIENMIWTLKNDVSPFPDRLQNAIQQLRGILLEDLPQIISQIQLRHLTVCIIPRAKAEGHYRQDQVFFKRVVSQVATELTGFSDGTAYITRHTDTKTTHLNRNGEGGDGNMPYPGITKDTCTISDQVRGRDILLIDDLYTKTINIDEDAIQALLDKGANSVVFYAVGNTKSKSANLASSTNSSSFNNDDLPF